MSSYRWELRYKCEDKDIEALLTNFGFEKADGTETYEVEVNEWNPLKADFVGKGRLEFTFHWMGESTTEIYYDYLIKCGSLIGQMMVGVEDIQKEGEK